MKTNRKTKSMKAVGILLVLALTISSVGMGGKVAEAKDSAKLKKACIAAGKKVGIAKKMIIVNSTSNLFDFYYLEKDGGRYSPKITSLYYTFHNEEEICVVEAKKKAYVKEISKSFANHKKKAIKYSVGYPKAQKESAKNAIYGSKGKYVWYIRMSSKKRNETVQAVLKKKL